MIMKQMTEVGTQVFTDHDAFHWLIDIAGALAALHSLSPPVIHRDLKQEVRVRVRVRVRWTSSRSGAPLAAGTVLPANMLAMLQRLRSARHMNMIWARCLHFGMA